jgi:AcrR family transcriptional regulator
VSPRRREKGRDESADLGPLPGGHHGLSREQVVESQRERLLAALVHTVAARGYRGATITEIVKAASVSSKAFYENFDSKEGCFLAAFDAVLAHLKELVGKAAALCPDWPQRLIAALRALLDFFESESDIARLCLVEPVTATPAIAARFREEVIACIPYLELGRAESADAATLPESTEDSLLGGLVTITSRSILAGDASLPELLPDLVEFALAPYLGPERARALAAEAAAEGS